MTEGCPRHFGAMPQDHLADLPFALRQRESTALRRWQTVCTPFVSDREQSVRLRSHRPRDCQVSVCEAENSFDATIAAMAETAKDMNSKYKETREAALAVSVRLC